MNLQPTFSDAIDASYLSCKEPRFAHHLTAWGEKTIRLDEKLVVIMDKPAQTGPGMAAWRTHRQFNGAQILYGLVDVPCSCC
ncbi:hypothetical protein ElyMa_003723000 [Elysia marginata]|uniref:Uncharacterized protein n=1 Tax=Elysia marginata TaxID=1093978 RepID=A0AAV4F513_9GAST|nr:hypothetical protein ElyMa_003723000 [Elysia marginata]